MAIVTIFSAWVWKKNNRNNCTSNKGRQRKVYKEHHQRFVAQKQTCGKVERYNLLTNTHSAKQHK